MSETWQATYISITPAEARELRDALKAELALLFWALCSASDDALVKYAANLRHMPRDMAALREGLR